MSFPKYLRSQLARDPMLVTKVLRGELERQAIERALDSVAGNRRKAAEQLGIGLRMLYEKIKRYKLKA